MHLVTNPMAHVVAVKEMANVFFLIRLWLCYELPIVEQHVVLKLIKRITNILNDILTPG